MINEFVLNLKEVDVYPFSFVQDFEGLKHMELMAAYYIDSLALLQPYPDEESLLDVTTRPFELPVWIKFDFYVDDWLYKKSNNIFRSGFAIWVQL